MENIFVGIDLGGTNIKVGCFDAELNLLKKTSVATQGDMGPEAVIDRIIQAVGEVLSTAGKSLDDVAAAGIGTPGPARYCDGIIIQCANMPKLKDFDIRGILSERLGKPVILENDANAACFGEHATGSGKGVDNMVFFTLGTGIGGGIISNGKLLKSSGDNEAELGHIIIQADGRKCNCGQKGCVEAYASAGSTARRAAEVVQAGEDSSLKQLEEITCKDVFEHAAAGDKLAERIVDETAKALAVVCVNMLHAIEPERFVFAGGMIAAGDALLGRIKRHFAEYIWDIKNEDAVEICFATLGEDAGIIGAAALAKNMLSG